MSVFRGFCNVFKHAFFALVLTVFSTAAFGACPSGWTTNNGNCVGQFPGISWARVTGSAYSTPNNCPAGWYTRTYGGTTDCYLIPNGAYYSNNQLQKNKGMTLQNYNYSATKNGEPVTQGSIYNYLSSNSNLPAGFKSNFNSWEPNNDGVTIFASPKDNNGNTILSNTSQIQIITNYSNARSLFEIFDSTNSFTVYDVHTYNTNNNTNHPSGEITSSTPGSLSGPVSVSLTIDNNSPNQNVIIIPTTGSCAHCTEVTMASCNPADENCCVDSSGNIKSFCICDQNCAVNKAVASKTYASYVENACWETTSTPYAQPPLCYSDSVPVPTCSQGNTCNGTDTSGNGISGYSVSQNSSVNIPNITVGLSGSFPSSPFTRTGYTFTGWHVIDSIGNRYGPYNSSHQYSQLSNDLTWVADYTYGGYFTFSPAWTCDSAGSGSTVTSNTASGTTPDVSMCAIRCYPGYYLPAGQSTCAVCPAGKYCVGGDFLSDANNNQGITGDIAAGYFSTNGATSATPNSTAGGENGNGNNGCVTGLNYKCGAVSAGYFSTGGATSATPNTTVGGTNGNGNNGCLSGYQCGLVDAGYFSTGGGTSATPNTTAGGANGTATNGSIGNGCISGQSCGAIAAGYFSTGGGKTATPNHCGTSDVGNPGSYIGENPTCTMGQDCVQTCGDPEEDGWGYCTNYCGPVAGYWYSNGGGTTTPDLVAGPGYYTYCQNYDYTALGGVDCSNSNGNVCTDDGDGNETNDTCKRACLTGFSCGEIDVSLYQSTGGATSATPFNSTNCENDNTCGCVGKQSDGNDNTCGCADGYVRSGNTCVQACLTITLYNTFLGGINGQNTITTLYKYANDTRWYTTKEDDYTCSNQITSLSAANLPTKTNATFTGYFTASNNTTTPVATGANPSVLSTTWTTNANTTIYAHYNCNAEYRGDGTDISGACTGSRYQIIFNANGGSLSGSLSGSSASLYVVYNTTTFYYNSFANGSVVNNVPSATKANSSFTGWYTSASGGTMVYDANGNLQASVSGYTNATPVWVITSGINLYAHWELQGKEITLKDYDGSGGNGTIYTIYNTGVYTDAAHTTAMTTSANPVNRPKNDGYTFSGYYSTQSGNGTQYIDADGKITSDGLLAAKGYTTNQTWHARYAECPACSVTNAYNCVIHTNDDNQCTYTATCDTGYGNLSCNNNTHSCSCSDDYTISYVLNGGTFCPDLESGLTPLQSLIIDSGHPYIQTDYYGNTNSRYEGAVYIPKDGYYIASQIDGGAPNVAFAYEDGTVYVGYGVIPKDKNLRFDKVDLDTRVDFITDFKNLSKSIILGGKEKYTQNIEQCTSSTDIIAGECEIDTNFVNDDNNNGVPLQIFFGGVGNDADYGSPSGTEIYYLRIYDNDVLVHNYIPVTDGNELGMFDTVGKREFLTNAGNGYFTGDTFKSNEYTSDACLEHYAIAPTSYTYGTGATINAIPNKTNAMFAGWCTDSNLTSCSDTQTIPTSGPNSYGNKTFYAKWCDACTTINADDCQVSLSNNTCTYTATCFNYHSGINGGTSAICNNNVCSCTANTYTITYNWYGGTPDPNGNTPESYTYGVGATISGTPTRTGYRFGGWRNSDTAENMGSSFTIGQFEHENKSYYALWSALVYNISYELNGGTASQTGMPATYAYGTGATINGTPTKDGGYEFAGWCTDEQLQDCAASQTIPNNTTGDKTFYAKWACPACTAGTGVAACSVNESNNTCTYTATCIANYYNPSITGSAASCTACPAHSRSDANNTADHCTCGTGYTVNGDPNGATEVSGESICKPIQTTITLDDHGGSDGSGAIYTKYNTDVYKNSNYTNAMTIIANPVSVPTKTGNYTFLGYYSSASGGTQYINANGYITNDGRSDALGYRTNNTWHAQWNQCAACSVSHANNCQVSVANNKCKYTATCDNGYSMSGGSDSTSTAACAGNVCSCLPRDYGITYNLNNGTFCPVLPLDYTALEYLEIESGHPYILTDYVGGVNSRYEGALSMPENNNNNDYNYYYIASQTDAKTDSQNIVFAYQYMDGYGEGAYVGYGTAPEKFDNMFTKIPFDEKIDFVTDFQNLSKSVAFEDKGSNEYIKLTQNIVSCSADNDCEKKASFTNTTPLQIFFHHADNNAYATAAYMAPVGTKIYYLRIYNNGNLVRNYIPVDKEGTPGMYDTINGEFFENANQENGSFTTDRLSSNDGCLTHYTIAPKTYTYGVGATIGGNNDITRIPTRTNHVFTGWTGSNGNTPQLSFSVGDNAIGNKSYTANWLECSCTAGTGVASCSVTGVSDNKCQYSYTCAPEYSNNNNDGGTFEGTAATGSNTSPNCTANTYTVTYAAGEGGSGNMNSGTATYGGSFTPASNEFTKSNATFNVWTISNTNDTNNGSTFTWAYTEDKTFTATWNCNAGYTLNNSTKACDLCANGTYKTSVGNEACTLCEGLPTNAHWANDVTNNSCEWACNSGYHLEGNACVENTIDDPVTPTDHLTYNGSAQNCPGLVSYMTGAIVTYSNSESGSYSNSTPSITDAGSTTVWYKLSKTNYTDKTGSYTCYMDQATCTVTLSETSGTLTYPTASGSFTATTTSDATLSVESGATGTATVSISNGTVTMTPVASGSVTITVTSPATNNYNSCSAAYTLTVSSKTITISNNNGSGTCAGGSMTCSYGGTCNAPTWDSSTCNITNGTKVLSKWNTASDGTGTDVTLGGDASNVSGTLYAVWSDCSCGTDTNATCTVQNSSDNTCQYKHVCTDGYYNANNNSTITSNTMTCTQCQAGTRCPTGATSETVCEAGYYSGAGASSCSVINGGYWNNGCGTDATGGVCTNSYNGGEINSGYYSNGGGTSATGACVSGQNCGECPTGYNGSDNGKDAITDCYKTCSSVTVTNADPTSVSPNNEKVYYDGSDYPNCTYNPNCESGYTATNGANPSCNANSIELSWFDADGSTQAAPDSTCVYDSGISLPDPAPTKEGYVFKGWIVRPNTEP